MVASGIQETSTRARTRRRGRTDSLSMAAARDSTRPGGGCRHELAGRTFVLSRRRTEDGRRWRILLCLDMEYCLYLIALCLILVDPARGLRTAGTSARRLHPPPKNDPGKLSSWLENPYDRSYSCSRHRGCLFSGTRGTEHVYGADDQTENWRDMEKSMSSQPPEASDDETASVSQVSLSSLALQIAKSQKQLYHQQMQIDRMLQVLIKQENPSSSKGVPMDSPQLSAMWEQPPLQVGAAASVVPLRTMLFIDGTWTYYSLFERNPSVCPIIQKYGLGWMEYYTFDWEALPRIICRSLQESGRSINGRPMEVTRASVFTSYKADTLTSSLRYKLFQDMRTAGYDVHQMETVGSSEKCVDIQVAVEMLHYATVPHSYDIAVLLSGDKDFMPALMRVRQKGRQVAIVSMKSSCNRALYETDGLKDYDVVWLEDHLDELLVPKDPSVSDEKRKNRATVAPFVVTKVIADFISSSGFDRVNSRDLGRYLKYLRVGQNSLSEEVKLKYVGLRQFLKSTGVFRVQTDSANSYMIVPNGEMDLAEMETAANLDGFNQELLRSFSASIPKSGDKDRYYSFTFHALLQGKARPSHAAPVLQSMAVGLRENTKEDYSNNTVAQLREICREQRLPTSGLKAELLERVQAHAKNYGIRDGHATPAVDTASVVRVYPTLELEKHLQELVKEYLHASGGKASSRDIGRYLAASKRQVEGYAGPVSALTELKAGYGGLTIFFQVNEKMFKLNKDFADGATETARYAFQVLLKS